MTQSDSLPPILPTLDPAQIERLNRRGPRYTSYPPVPDWHGDFTDTEYALRLHHASQDRPDEPLSLYVHVPFCESMCTYCGCNVIVSQNRDRMDRYLDSVLLELGTVARLLGHRRQLARIHWGGGTPTHLNEMQTRRLMAGIAKHFELTGNAEVAVELHPGVTDVERLQLLRKLGFNRLSMGVQDFDPRVQKAIGREQSLEQTACLVSGARALGYDSINFDLVYGLPGQTLDTWQQTLAQISEMSPDRLAVYGFAYLPKQRPNQRKLDASLLPDPETRLALFGEAWRHFIDQGLVPIGMDHFAKPEDELARAQQERRLWRDFMGYTVRQANDSVAVGVTGISDIDGCYAQNLRPLGAYHKALSEGRLPISRGIRLTPEDERRRRLITQLMCNLQVDLADYTAPGVDPREHFAAALADLPPLEAEGLLTLDDTRLDLTALGRVFVRNVAMVFDPRLRGPVTHGVKYSATV